MFRRFVLSAGFHMKCAERLLQRFEFHSSHSSYKCQGVGSVGGQMTLKNSSSWRSVTEGEKNKDEEGLQVEK